MSAQMPITNEGMNREDVQRELAANFQVDGKYLLRRECPCTCHDGPGFIPSRDTNPHCCAEGICDWCIRGHFKEPGYVYDDSPNALTEAIRAKGWSYRVYGTSAYGGDEVTIIDYPSGGFVIGKAIHKRDHLYGSDAIELALYRACRAEAGEDGSN